LGRKRATRNTTNLKGLCDSLFKILILGDYTFARFPFFGKTDASPSERESKTASPSLPALVDVEKKGKNGIAPSFLRGVNWYVAVRRKREGSKRFPHLQGYQNEVIFTAMVADF